MKVVVFDRKETGIPDYMVTSVEDLVTQKVPSNTKIAFVSTANSLLFMDGGSDLGYMNAFTGIQQKCQQGARLLNKPSLLGRPCLMIGNALGFELEKNVFFISTPTMFLPQDVCKTENIYHALKPALILARSFGVETAFVPSFCTNFGGMTFQESYSEMMRAIADKDESGYTLTQIGQYNACLCDSDIQEKVISQQPKLHQNVEFGVSLSDIGYSLRHKNWQW